MWHTLGRVALDEQAAVHVGPQGRLVIPANLRRQLRLETGETLVARVEEDRLVLERPRAALGRLQRAFREAVPPGVSLVDELLADRRAEAHGEESR
ncbi:MAG TPA: AbrB/MazE/SpoVT family DNA-binding domain-containing protein [Candidatus Dormibacteraeota bacterium]|nr:AbrB/MazE/SpoVT family DNA-binding domain-containing protein [Candidatus Dormibacteraeota bacterium]